MKIFLSTPISCYKGDKELQNYKESIYPFLSSLQKDHEVLSEIQNINNKSDYDTPEKSISMDLKSIQECEVFILHYPLQAPTSALIELGFAIAFNKKIIIITPKASMLPYLALGIPINSPTSTIIESDCLDMSLVQTVLSRLK